MSNSNDSSSSNEAISSNSDSSSSSDDAIVNAIMCESSSDKEIILAEMIEKEQEENKETMEFLMARRASLRKKRRHTYRKREEAASDCMRIISPTHRLSIMTSSEEGFG